MKTLLLPAFLLLGTVLACASPPRTIPAQVEYAGCAAVLLPGPVCRLGPDRTLRLWIGAPPDARIEIRAGGNRLDARGEAVQNGQRFSLAVPAGAESVDVRVATERGRASWSLSFSEVAPVRLDALKETNEALVRVDDSIRKLQLTAAREALQSLRLPPGSPAESLFNLSYYRGLLAEKEGDYRTSFAEMQKAVRTAERVRLDSRWMAEQKLALLLRAVGRSQDSVRLFERLRRTPHSTSPCREGQFLNNHAWTLLLAREAGERSDDPASLLQSALAVYEGCRHEDARIKRANIRINLVLAHLQEDRLQAAKNLLARVQDLEPHLPLPLELWRLDLAARIGLREGRVVEALRRFEELEALAATTGSFDGRLRAAFGQARSLQALGDRAAALETLRTAEALLDEQSLQIPLHEGRETFLATRQALVSLHVELLLEEGRNAEALSVARQARARLLRQLERSSRLASLTPEQRTEWERLQAEYQAKRADLEARAKDDWRLPADRQAREREARLAEGELLKGLLDQAFQILDKPGERWKEPPPRPGELILAYHPLRYGQWVRFAADGRTVRAQRFEMPPSIILRNNSEELARRLLEPFRDSIRQARRVRILACGLLQTVDFHALPFGGDVLLSGRPVVYGLDVQPAAAPPPVERRALLVADPHGDLPGTREEARMVREILESGSPAWSVRELDDEQASAKAVQEGLIRVSLLHYAGHGTFSGFGGWDSGLLLAGDTRLTLGDLLALGRVPAWVVLAACDAGQSSSEIPVESLGLAHAFLLAGSRSVVASTRPADDRKVPRFFADLYRELDREPDPALALQRAQLAWREREPRTDWAGFRLFEP